MGLVSDHDSRFAFLMKSLEVFIVGGVYLIVGIVLIVASFAVFTGSQFARWIGIIAGAILAISAVAWLPFYPVWSLVYILLGVVVVYAMAVYGGRLPEDF